MNTFTDRPASVKGALEGNRLTASMAGVRQLNSGAVSLDA
jgi:hypothetical protein